MSRISSLWHRAVGQHRFPALLAVLMLTPLPAGADQPAAAANTADRDGVTATQSAAPSATEPKTAATAEPAASSTAASTATSATPPDSAAAPPPDSADVALPSAGPHKVLLLPLTFTVFQNGVGSFEAVPDWTEAARKNLSDAARDAVRTAGGLELEALPELSVADVATLRNHVAVARLIVATGNQYKYKHGDWHNRRASFDRSFGAGLQFLHERTGADYALLVDGSQVKPSAGRIFMQIALLAGGIMVVGGGGTVVKVSLLDLTNGQVIWFNSSLDIEILGIGGADLRKPGTAQSALSSLFASYPAIPALAN